MSLTTLQILILKCIPGIGNKTILKIGKQIDSIDTKDMLLDVLLKNKVKIKDRNSNEKRNITIDDLEKYEIYARKIIYDNKKLDIGIISYYEHIFPQILRETKNEQGNLEDPPLILYYKGNIDLLKMPCVAIIGTREPTDSGRKASIYLAEGLAKRCFCIVSGLARGCDSASHIGALNVHGKTLAFLAHGLDIVYPPENKKLADAILNHDGLLMSEYPQGTNINKYAFVARDRLQAGLALATIVIQTDENGGSMHAANATLNAGKPLYVVKYADYVTENHLKTRGNKLLLKKGAKEINYKIDFAKLAQEILSSGKYCIQDSLI